jgi:hypothetical protein
MSWLRFLRRKRSDAELRDEIDAFLTEETADNVARGISPDEARRRARVRLGNPQKVRESLWRQNSFLPLTHVGHDLKYAFRTLSRTPGFSIIAVAVMALCIGAATSLFTIVRSVLLRPLPFRDPDRLVMVYEHRCKPECDPGSCRWGHVAASCLSGLVRRAVVSGQSANLGTWNSHGTRRATRSAFAVDAGRWPAPGAVRARAWPGAELGDDTHLPVDAFRNQGSRSCGPFRGNCDAVGGRGFGLPCSRMACFPVRSNASAANRIALGYASWRPSSTSFAITEVKLVVPVMRSVPATPK